MTPDDIVIGSRPSPWRDLRFRLSEWLNPYAAFGRKHMPEDPVAREIAMLVFCHLDNMGAADRAEILADLRRRLGIRPLKTRHLPYVGPED